MKQHVTPEQFRAIPEAQQEALALWRLRRDFPDDEINGLIGLAWTLLNSIANLEIVEAPADAR